MCFCLCSWIQNCNKFIMKLKNEKKRWNQIKTVQTAKKLNQLQAFQFHKFVFSEWKNNSKLHHLTFFYIHMRKVNFKLFQPHSDIQVRTDLFVLEILKIHKVPLHLRTNKWVILLIIRSALNLIKKKKIPPKQKLFLETKLLSGSQIWSYVKKVQKTGL